MSEVGATSRAQTGATVLRKVLVSLVAGAAAYAITILASLEEAVWAITLSVFVAGVFLVVQFLIGFEARLTKVETAKERHSATIERTVADGFAQVNEVTGMFGQIRDSAVSAETVAQLVQRAALIRPPVTSLVSRFAQASIVRTSELLKGLSEGGTLLYDGEDREWLLGLTRHAESSIDATSLTAVDAAGRGFTDGGFWASDLGQRYLEAQQEAVRRGVAIRRVFVILHPADPTAGLNDVCRLQQDCGIDVRVLPADQIPPRLRDAMFDFILFDKVVSYEVTAATRFELVTQPTTLQTRLEQDADKVAARSQRFRELWAAAQPFK